MHLPVNTLLQGGRYRIVRFISSGGFGCTYEAEHVLLEKRVAIKEFFVKDFCNRDEATSPISVGTVSKKGLVEKLRRKFVDEAKALCRLQHPGIVSVSDVFEENGTAYYVMDYVDGKSLGDLVKQEGPLSEDRAVRYIRQVAEALQYVHENNRLHLDIKPGNIMIDGNDDAILIDFGASKQYDEESGENTSSLLGRTPGYAPPEQMSNSVVKFLPATDIYALGATLYKVLTGVTPPDAFMRISGEELEPLPSHVSGATRGAVSAAMSINKNQRPQTVGAFLQLLDACGTDGEEGEGTVLDSDPKNSDQQETPAQPGKSKERSSSGKDGQGNKKPFPWWTLALAAGVVMVVVLLSVMRPKPVVVESISMDKESLSLQEGESTWLSVQYTPLDAVDKTTEWISTDVGVAQVDGSGKVEAVGAGTADIIASCNEKFALCNVTVTARAVESISMDKESLSLQEGESAILSVQYTPSNAADKTTAWRSTDENVAQVDKSGKVKAISVGTAKIIASCNEKEAFCNLTVIPKIEMVYVAGGKFVMGATFEQGSDAADWESPVHVVELSDYYIGKYEVTQALWKSVMGTNPNYYKGPDFPVENVSWDEVQEFIRKLNAMTGKKYRLPTEAEWEYAARGGKKSRGYKYSGSDDIGTVAWYCDNSERTTHPVGTKAANELGIHDMSGSVWEWCSDWYGDYSKDSQTNPQGPSSGSARVFRGGHWYNIAWYCRVSYRDCRSPDFDRYGIGFRLAASSL